MWRCFLEFETLEIFSQNKGFQRTCCDKTCKCPGLARAEQGLMPGQVAGGAGNRPRGISNTARALGLSLALSKSTEGAG